MTYTYTTQSAVRAAFWHECEGRNGVTRRKITNYSGNGKMHNTDTRCAFADFIDTLCKNGEISQHLAFNVTID